MAKPSDAKRESGLRVSEIFFSIQGESSRAGVPTIFIRLTGCPLRCRYCDTAYAFSGGSWMAIDEILERIRAFPSAWVTLTGGEPLAQPGAAGLLTRLCDAGYAVSLETSGALDIGGIDPRVKKILDVKTPASGEQARNRTENFAHLGPDDEVKFVVCDRADYDWTKTTIAAHRLTERCSVLLSPVSGEQDPGILADWILADGLPVRLQVQLHKILWGDVRGR